ncbi:MAG: asparagine--tRNA ligase [Rhabdochlamydiaceae bacterium]
MKRTRIQSITSELLGKTITICGWVRTVRDQKNFAFVEINDGSTLAGFQIIMEGDTKDLTTGASVRVKGTVVESPGGKQKLELKASHVEILGLCPADEYPLQKKRHSFEFLRTIAHLRPRTNTQGAVQRVRNQLAFATHEFFQQHGFLYVQTPIISSSDAEGGGQQFNVTALPLAKLPKLQDGAVDYSQDFFHRPTYLTVSGQLEGEAMACALSDIYTFGPTFRAENSNTSRHLAEFWMIEPEMAFADLKDNMELAEKYLKFIIQSVLKKCSADLEFFDNFVEKGLIARLQHVATSPFAHLTYTEAVEILKKSGKTFEYPVEWGTDLQSEHERYLAEEHCKKPVILTDYPAKIKAFYMRMNPDEKTVAAMDVLVPKIGEIIGGSQREDRLDRLKEKILAQGLKLEEYDWYLQLRRYGSVPHAGFGAGFERLVLFVTGMENIRDVIPFPRYPGHAEF